MAGNKPTVIDGVLNDDQQVTATRFLEKGRYAILAIGAITLFFPWLSVSGLFSQTVTGFTFDTGKLYLLTLVAIAALDYTGFKLARENVWLGGGVLLTILAVLSWFNVDSAISQFEAEMAGNMFAGAVSITAGAGLYLAILVGVLTVAVGWTLRRSSV